ncbi:MAG: type II toxin-antitoxin system VapC family toxin [Chloroflexota bacterium]
MTTAVVDASVFLARVLVEQRPAWIDDVLEGAAAGHLELLAPSLLWVGYGNRWVRRDTSDERALEALVQQAEAIGIQLVETTRPLRLRALVLARQHRLTMYDALYPAVAEAAGAPLFTLDDRLARATDSMGLGHEGERGRISEPSVPHLDRPVDTTSLAAIGRAIAQMPREPSS